MGLQIGTFPQRQEFQRAKSALDALALPYQIVSPDPGFALVGTPSLVLDDSVRLALAQQAPAAFVCSGWVDYRPSRTAVPPTPPPTRPDDLIASIAIVVLAPCMADPLKIRLIAHTTAHLAPALPYLNAEMRQGSYNREAQTLSYMDGPRMISVFDVRIALAKANDLVDAWRSLETLRQRLNDVWSRRTAITPCYERRAKPPALEIYQRLPKTNCGACGEKTCMAFALRLWTGDTTPSRCRPMFQGDYQHMRPAFTEICTGLGLLDDPATASVATREPFPQDAEGTTEKETHGSTS